MVPEKAKIRPLERYLGAGLVRQKVFRIFAEEPDNLNTMKRALLLTLLLAASPMLRVQAQTTRTQETRTQESQAYPFQNPALSEDERLDNVVSLMTVDEKLATLVGQGVPRLGIANPGATEAIHGIVRGGDAELPGLNVGQFGGWPGRPKPKYRNSTAFPQAYGIGETWDREMVTSATLGS